VDKTDKSRAPLLSSTIFEDLIGSEVDKEILNVSSSKVTCRVSSSVWIKMGGYTKSSERHPWGNWFQSKFVLRHQKIEDLSDSQLVQLQDLCVMLLLQKFLIHT